MRPKKKDGVWEGRSLLSVTSGFSHGWCLRMVSWQQEALISELKPAEGRGRIVLTGVVRTGWLVAYLETV